MGKIIDLTGQRFGMLTVIEQAPKPEGSHSTSAFWRCRCDCGNEKIISGNVLKAGKSKSCGCLNYKQRDLTSLVGKTFGKLTVLSRAERPPGVKSKDAYWHCKCECGKEKDVLSQSLRFGRSLSCGNHGNISKGNVKISEILDENHIILVTNDNLEEILENQGRGDE